MTAPQFGPRGQAFLDSMSVPGRYSFRPDEWETVTEMCRLLDLMERLQTAVANGPLQVTGSRNQPVANPDIQELDRARNTYRQLAKFLALPSEDDGDADLSESEQAIRAVRNRYNARGEKR